MNYLEDYLIEDLEYSLYKLNPQISDIPQDIQDAVSYLRQYANFCYMDNVCQDNPFHQLYSFVDGPESIKIEELTSGQIDRLKAILPLTKHSFILAKICDIIGVASKDAIYQGQAADYYEKFFRENLNISDFPHILYISLKRAIFLYHKSNKNSEKNFVEAIFTTINYNNREQEVCCKFYAAVTLSEIKSKLIKNKVQYYVKLYLYWKMIDKDRKTVFDTSYRTLLDQLADRGWFLYFLQTPDIPIEGKTVEDAEQVIEKMYGDNNCIYFSLFFKDIITVDSKNELRKNKANDLQEALECLMNGAYQSCARTMFALLENEHVNASSLEKRSRGVERADEITKYVKETGSAFYKNIWSKLNKQYKQLNCDTDKMNHSNINRNDLAHGKYIHIATKVDCMKLMLLYATFKELSFYLQTMVDFINDFKKGLLVHIIDEISKQQSKK